MSSGRTGSGGNGAESCQRTSAATGSSSRIVVGVDRKGDVVPDELRDHSIVGACHQEDGFAHPLLPQLQRLIGPDDRESLDVRVRLEQARDDAIVEAIAVILYYRQQRTSTESPQRTHIVREVGRDHLDPRIGALRRLSGNRKFDEAPGR